MTDEPSNARVVIETAAKTHELQASLYRHVRRDPQNTLSPALAEHVRCLSPIFRRLVECFRLEGQARCRVFTEAQEGLSSQLALIRETVLRNDASGVVLIDPKCFGASSSIGDFVGGPLNGRFSLDQMNLVIDVVQSMELKEWKGQEPVSEGELGSIERDLDDVERWLGAYQAV